MDGAYVDVWMHGWHIDTWHAPGFVYVVPVSWH